MAQQFIFENSMPSTVKFSTVNPGDIFIYTSLPCLKLDKNNPNYVVFDTGENGKLNDTDQVLIPKKAILHLE
jgi:hypothetical protein